MVILGVAAFNLGLAIGHRGLTIQGAVQRLQTEVRQAHPGPVAFHSVFVNLAGERRRIPVSRAGYGGGLTVMESGVIVLTHEGRLFFVGPDRVVHPMPVQVPDNGHAGLVRVSKLPEFAGYWFDLEYHRYNHVLYVAGEDHNALYLSYTEFFENERCFTSTVARLHLPAGLIDTAAITDSGFEWSIVYRTEPCLPLKDIQRAMEGHIAGGRMEWDRANSQIFLTVGDYTWDGVWGPKAISRLPDWHYGKVIRIPLDTEEASVFSKGHRNPQGITLDLEGRLWVVENGPRGGDELNLVREGADYGWPDETLGTLYNTLPWPNTRSFGRHDYFTPPVYAWLPSVAPSSLTVVNGFHDAWHGDLLMTTMGGQSLFRLRIEDESVQFAERIFIGQRLRDVVQLNETEIVLWTDRHQLFFLRAVAAGAEQAIIDRVIEESGVALSTQAVIRRHIDNCMRCHEVAHGVHINAPSLSSIYGERIGGTSFPHYSDALARKGARWDARNLMQYIRAPSEFAPGTTMPETGIDDDEVLKTIVEVMRALKLPIEEAFGPTARLD